jgi:phage gp46-like protein
MSGDIALIFNADANGIPVDALVSKNDLVTENGLQTSVIISLFTDRRVTEDDLPPEETSFRGWWGDLFQDEPGDLIGSRLWLLAREKRSVETLNRAVEYSEEALQWMVEDGVAESVSADAIYDQNGFMILSISIVKSGATNLSYRFRLKWDAEAARS